MDHFVEIYKNRAADYHALIAAEDADGNLLPALQTITSLAGKRVLDLGSGSGRIPFMLKDMDCTIVAMDLHRPMLKEQQKQMRSAKEDWRLVQADIRQLAIVDGWADISIAGWVVGHFTGWYEDSWRAEANRALDEMRRSTRPDGFLIILETMGTGVLQPDAPNSKLADYYAWLENDLGFKRQVVATDYDFGSVVRAKQLCGFFFGEEMTERVRANSWRRVPEWTGIWSWSKES